MFLAVLFSPDKLDCTEQMRTDTWSTIISNHQSASIQTTWTAPFQGADPSLVVTYSLFLSLPYSCLCVGLPDICKPYYQGWPEPYIYGVYTVFLAGKSPYIRSCTVYIYVLANPTYYPS
jgi:hypothetical protein